jgi:tetratricopeptide (TPR) repeat protein
VIELLLQAERALSVGLLDRAETLYAQVAGADPRNSIAVVGLARVALERGDETGALDLSRRALTIDPENVAAQRMVARLEEVIAYRSEGVHPVVNEDLESTEIETTSDAERAPEPEAEPEAAEPEVAQPAQPAEPAEPEPTAPPRKRSWLARLFRRR